MSNSLLPFLKAVYKNDLKEIISLLNDSFYITEYFTSNNSEYVHTGVKFEIQTNQFLEVFYYFNGDVLVVQPPTEKINQEPKLGDIFIREDKYINTPTILSLTFLGLRDDDRKIYNCEYADINKTPLTKDSYLTIPTFQSMGRIQEFKFYKRSIVLGTKIYLGNGRYEKYNPFLDPNSKESDDHIEDDDFDDSFSGRSSFYDATDGQLGDMGDDGWAYLGRD